jgi:inner membrane protein
MVFKSAMEPVTHFLVGACIGRAGLRRLTAYATLAGVLAAEAADLDVLWSLTGPVHELQHHRGITHTFIAAPVVAAVVTGVIFLFDLYWKRRRARRLASPPAPEPGAPPIRRPVPARWGWIYLTALLAALSHLLLDWTNNYGLRPFYPFNPRWYAGSFVFIAEPVLWLLLIGAFLLPALGGLVAGEIGARRQPFRGERWAIAALIGMVLLWGWRYAEQARARGLVENTQLTQEPVQRLALEPYPLNPFRWHALLETAHTYQTAEVDTRTGEILSEPGNAFFKPPSTPATEAAKRTSLGRVYLDWGSWAVVRDLGPVPEGGMEPPQLTAGRAWTTVQFTDLRFAYDFRGSGATEPRAALSGWVYIVDGREEAGQALGSREQH